MGKFIIKGTKTLKSGMASVIRNCKSPVEDQTVEPFEAIKCPKFEVYKDKAGEFRFRLRASNGQNIVHGEGYSSKSSCLNGIDSIGRNATEDAKVVREE